MAVICPNCGLTVTSGNVCPKCKIDAVLYSKTLAVSDSLYNKGLMKAGNNDLSGAAECLSKCLDFNKNNIMARNLLGLVYYQTGRIGDALKQWVISASFVKDDNPAQDYIDTIHKNRRMLERHNDSIKMYNQALSYLTQKSDDMAIIQLKKALELNPNFVDALNLLALSYLIQKDRAKAIATIERVLAIDINNGIAVNYLYEITPNKPRPDMGTAVKPQKSTQDTYAGTPSSLSVKDKKKYKKEFSNNFFLPEILTFIVGAACMFAVFYLLLLPPRLEEKDNEYTALQASKTEMESDYEETIRQKNDRITEVEGERDEIKNRNDSLNSQILLMNKEKLALEIAVLSVEGKHIEAADLLITMDTTGLSQDTLDNLQALEDKSYPLAAKTLYDSGVKLYNSKDYEESRASLEKSIVYADRGSNYYHDLLYHLGLLAEIFEDTDEAKEYYQDIVDNYSNSNRKNAANNRLKALENA